MAGAGFSGNLSSLYSSSQWPMLVSQSGGRIIEGAIGFSGSKVAERRTRRLKPVAEGGADAIGTGVHYSYCCTVQFCDPSFLFFTLNVLRVLMLCSGWGWG